jgi:hypothetical protein
MLIIFSDCKAQREYVPLHSFVSAVQFALFFRRPACRQAGYRRLVSSSMPDTMIGRNNFFNIHSV